MFNQYMKNMKWVIIACVIMLLAAVVIVIAVLWYQSQQPEEREFSGMFVKGGFHGHLYQAQEEGDFI